MRHPHAAHREANTNLDGIGNAMVKGATPARDLVMRLVVMTRAILTQHSPTHRARGWYCRGCGNEYPCPEVYAAFIALGVHLTDPGADS